MEGEKNGFIPLADANPYANLLNTHYRRAAEIIQKLDSTISIADLGFAIFDELIPNESIDNMDIGI